MIVKNRNLIPNRGHGGNLLFIFVLLLQIPVLVAKIKVLESNFKELLTIHWSQPVPSTSCQTTRMHKFHKLFYWYLSLKLVWALIPLCGEHCLWSLAGGSFRQISFWLVPFAPVPRCSDYIGLPTDYNDSLDIDLPTDLDSLEDNILLQHLLQGWTKSKKKMIKEQER